MAFLTSIEKMKKITVNILKHYNDYTNSTKKRLKKHLEVCYLKYVRTSAYPLRSNWYFTQERKSFVTKRRPDATLCVKFNEPVSYQIFGSTILLSQ